MSNNSITVVCQHCQNHDKSPNIEIDFTDGYIYYVCIECKKMNKVSLTPKRIPLPKARRL